MSNIGGPSRPVGINTVLFSPLSLSDALGHIARCGYDGVELAALGRMCEHLPLDSWQEQVAGIREQADSLGLQLLSIEEAALNPERMEKAFAAAQALGVGVVNVGPGGKSDEPGALEASIESLRQGAKRAAEYGVTLCVKAHVGAAMYNTPTTLRVLDAIPDESFGVDIDPSHIFRAGEDPVESLKAILDRIRHVHIRDCPKGVTGPGPIAQQACGRGDMNLTGFCDVLVKGNYSGPVCLEVIGAKPEDALTDLVTVAAETRGYLKAAFDAAGAHNGS